jgi:RNA polymerase sigma-70 factor (ECF subfamily)
MVGRTPILCNGNEVPAHARLMSSPGWPDFSVNIAGKQSVLKIGGHTFAASLTGEFVNDAQYFPGAGFVLDSSSAAEHVLPLSGAPTGEQLAVQTDVAAARAGDRAAFGRLYARYLGMVHGLLLARVPRTDVDDLVQEVFLQAMRKLSTLRDAAAFGGWLAMIARNRAHDFFRSSKPETELVDNLPATSGKPDAEALAAMTAIRQLPEAYRETLILRLVEGLSGAEIADRTGLTPGSVRVNLHRGMAQLREILSKERKI